MTTTQDTWDALLCEVDEDGDRYWYDETGELHRENGPALIDSMGSRFWYKHGKLHREDGPAYVLSTGYATYWVDGEYLTEEQFNARKLTING